MTKYQATWNDGYRVVWRNLTWSEYRQFEPAWLNHQFKCPMELYLSVYRAVYLDGPVPEVVPAGIVVFIAEQQLANNPFNGTYENIVSQLVHSREVVNDSYLHTARSLVAAAFKYSFEEMDSWDRITFFIRVAQAEIILGKLIDPSNPNIPRQQEASRPLSAREKAILRTKERDKR